MITRIALFLGSLAVLSTNLHLAPKKLDEGLVLDGALRILDGQLPFRDFFALYPPGQFYSVALVFSLFGTGVVTERLYDLFLRAAICMIMYECARRTTTRPGAVVAWILALIWVGVDPFYGYPVIPAVLIIELALLCWLHSGGALPPAPAYLLIAACIWFRADFALYGAAALLVTIAADCLVGRRDLIPCLLKVAARLALCSSLSVSLALLCFPAREMYEMLLVVPIFITPEQSHFPFPRPGFSMNSLMVYFPLYMLAAILFLIRHNRAEWGRSENLRRLIAYQLSLSVFSYAQALNRLDIAHVMPASITVSMLIAVVITLRQKEGAALIVTLLAVLLVLLDVAIPVRWIAGRKPEQVFEHAIERARGVMLSAGQLEALRYVISRCERNESMWVGESRHDRLTGNDASFNFLSSTRSPSRYGLLVPGVTNTKRIQQEIVSELERDRTRTIVLRHQKEKELEPNLSSQSSEVYLLDEYIAGNYRLIDSFEDYAVLERR